MATFIRVAIFATLVAGMVLYSDADRRMRRMEYGHDVTNSSAWPMMVSLRNHTDGHWCGGTLMTPDLVLTAAHCVEPVGKIPFVALGTHNSSSQAVGRQKLRVLKTIVHPKYSVGRYVAHDVAVLVIQPANLTNTAKHMRWLENPDLNDPVEGTSCKILGWGYRNGLIPGNLQMGDTSTSKCPENSDGDCASFIHLSPNPAIPQGGDSGGPLLCRYNENWRQYGICSFGFGNLSGYARIAAYRNDWLKNIIASKKASNSPTILYSAEKFSFGSL